MEEKKRKKKEGYTHIFETTRGYHEAGPWLGDWPGDLETDLETNLET